ncbi:MAG: hypothetical protein KDA22_12375, partial [Phycisphaerales bacterium]|nr:hypothetical protein [Phycisphaerales bacterium]
NGTASFRFRLFNQALGGVQMGPTLTACNLSLSNGLFTAELDFGADVFEGSERWLDIAVESPAGACAAFTPLGPRQLLSAAPYAVRSLAPWATSGTSTYYNAGNVGIGTSSPIADLEISGADSVVRLSSTGNGGTSQLDLQGDTPSGLSTNTLGLLRFLDDAGGVHAQIASNKGLFGAPLLFTIDGTAAAAFNTNGDFGIGTTLPIARLQLAGGTDSEPGSGGFLVLGTTDAANISIDNNEIMARNAGGTSTLYLNNDGGDVSIIPNGGGQCGIGTPPTASTLTVFNSLFVNGGAQPRIDVGPNGFILMDTGADITITNGGLEVNTPSGGSTFFNRTASDGTLINFYNNSTFAGGISVVGSTVSYNTFTGSHHAWTDTTIEPGSLVALTGENQRDHAGPNCEVVYGIAPVAQANDPACLGSYLCPPDPSDPDSRHLVAAVGNGEMWVVDAGTGDIEPGDALIASDVTGCAMLDDPSRFAVGHVVARAAEGIRWSSLPATAGGKRVLLSVFFDRFDRQGDAAAMEQAVQSLRDENAALQARLDDLERSMAEWLRSAKEEGR